MKYIPNILSGWRILTFPLLLWFIYQGQRDAFVWLLCINLVTDILDGFIARTFKLETELGAKLDSLADVGSYVAAFSGMIFLESKFVSNHLIEFSILIGLYVAGEIISLIRFGSTSHFHLYSNKATGYLSGFFFLTYFTYGYIPFLFYFLLVFGSFAYIESLIIAIMIPKLRSNLKSIYHLYKEHGKIQ
ncbi:MAG: CDP-alcohol phosphatidyltransferase family protein [Bacteroidetes bacterium]|nr:CDP-alcohol phosphatidyltransferase family protein [Bacteroidota bacterium]